MAKTRKTSRPQSRRRRPSIRFTAASEPPITTAQVSSSVEDLLLAALTRGDTPETTGRYLVTFKEGAGPQAAKSLKAEGLRMADTRDFDGQRASLEALGDAEAVLFPEVGVALIGGPAAAERSSLAESVERDADSPIASVDPEYFVFADTYFDPRLAGDRIATGYQGTTDALRTAARILEVIARELGGGAVGPVAEQQEEIAALGVTWGLSACRVPPSTRSGAGIKVAVLDTGMDLGHPDFAGRSVTSAQFVGQQVQDLHGHGTHCIGTACGSKTPPGFTPRYGIAFRSQIFVGKVLANSGGSVGASVLSGMNWAIANRCAVISMSLSGPGGPHPAYTAAGQAALNNGLLMIAASGNASSPAGAPANSPTIMSVASLDSNLTPSSFSNHGKIDIAGPGRDIFSSWIRPTRYRTISGTSMATPHVAGCAALWAESSPSLRGTSLWDRLRNSVRTLPFPPARVGAGLVQAP